MKERSAGIIIVKGDEFLVLHYAAGHWDFPKGKIEPGESEPDAALRELEEETGITEVDVLSGFEETIHYVFKREGETVSKDVLFFLGRVASDNITLSHEHKDFVWLPFERAVEKVTFKTAKEVLRKAQAFLESYEKS